jgi:hypothetical protein
MNFSFIANVVGWWLNGSDYELQFANGTTRNATSGEILSATKAQRIEADRQECRRRLTEHYGDALEQVSRSAGLYGETARANHETGVTEAIAASNTARGLINAAATVEAVEAVTVSWPVLV